MHFKFLENIFGQRNEASESKSILEKNIMCIIFQENKYQPKEESNEFGLSPMNNRVHGSWQKRQMQKDR